MFRQPTDTGIDAIGITVAGVLDLETELFEQRLNAEFNTLCT